MGQLKLEQPKTCPTVKYIITAGHFKFDMLLSYLT